MIRLRATMVKIASIGILNLNSSSWLQAVGGEDHVVIDLNRQAYAHLPGDNARTTGTLRVPLLAECLETEPRQPTPRPLLRFPRKSPSDAPALAPPTGAPALASRPSALPPPPM